MMANSHYIQLQPSISVVSEWCSLLHHNILVATANSAIDTYVENYLANNEEPYIVLTVGDISCCLNIINGVYVFLNDTLRNYTEIQPAISVPAVWFNNLDFNVLLSIVNLAVDKYVECYMAESVEPKIELKLADVTCVLCVINDVYVFVRV